MMLKKSLAIMLKAVRVLMREEKWRMTITKRKKKAATRNSTLQQENEPAFFRFLVKIF